MKRALRIAGGSSLLVVGVPMLVLPGPGLLAIFAGTTILASEFEWASEASAWAKRKAALLKSDGERPSK